MVASVLRIARYLRDPSQQPLSPRTSPLHRTAFGLFTVGAFAFAALLTYNALAIKGELTTDSLFYIDAANNFLAGRGIVNSMSDYDRLLEVDRGLPVPMTHWPPMYPLLIAGVSTFCPNSAYAAILVSAGFVLFILAASFALTWRLYGAAYAMFVTAMLCHLQPLLLMAYRAWSETAGLAFAVAAAYFAVQARPDTKRSGLWWFAAGLALSLAIATRYAFLPLVALLPLVHLNLRQWKGMLVRGCWYGGGLAVVLGPLFIRNKVVGSFGGPRWGSGHTALEGFQHLGQTLATSFRIDSTMTGSLMGIVLIGAVVAALRSFWKRDFATTLRDAFWSSGRWVLWAWPLLYCAFILYAQTKVSIGPIAHRLALPAIFFLSLLIVLGTLRVLKLRATVLAGLAFIPLATALYTQVATARSFSGLALRPAHDLARKIDRSPSLSWLSENIGTSDLLIAEKGIDIPMYIGPVDTAFFPRMGRPGKPLAYDTMLGWLRDDNRCCRYRRIVLLIHPTVDESATWTEPRGDFLPALLDDAGPYPEFERIETLEDAVLFEIKCCADLPTP
jgi:hypothetical protein